MTLIGLKIDNSFVLTNRPVQPSPSRISSIVLSFHVYDIAPKIGSFKPGQASVATMQFRLWNQANKVIIAFDTFIFILAFINLV